MAFPRSKGYGQKQAVLRTALVSLTLLLPASVCRAQTVTFATYLGLADCDGIALGPSGDIYLACHSPSNHLPSAEAQKSEIESDEDAHFDAYVLRINPQTGKLVYATRIGGSDYDEAAKIKVDRKGFAYSVGMTKSRDFPTTPNAMQRQYGGGDSDAFVVKLAPTGQIVYATYLGGTGSDDADGLELGGEDEVFVGGMTESTNFPGQAKPRVTSKEDAFVSRIDLSRATLHSVVFGGKDDEMVTGLSADGRGGVFAVGFTKSSDFPIVQPVQAELRGVSDLFLARLDTSTLSLTFSTFFGGSGDDSGWGVTVDHRGNPIVTGLTDSKDLVRNPGTFQPTNAGGKDAFIAEFAGRSYSEVRSTYWGGTKDDYSGADGDDVKVDSQGNIWLAGSTSSLDLPTRHAVQAVYGGGDRDGYIAAFSPDLKNLCYSTYRGGSDRDWFEGIAISSRGLVYATGATTSEDLKMSGNSVQNALAPVKFVGKFFNATVLGLRFANPCRLTGAR
jgi:hypothetical protein